MTITSKYGPPFNEGNWPKKEWEARKSGIKFFIESQRQIRPGYSFAIDPVLEMLADLWVALEAEEADNEEYGKSLSIIYDEASGGMISKPNTNVEEVIRILYERFTDEYNRGWEHGKEEGIAGQGI